MRVRDVMEQDFDVVRPDQSLREAAHLMLRRGVSMLPVQQDGRLVGLISRRDIAVRAAAEGRSAGSAIGTVMSRDLKYCFDDDDCQRVRETIGEHPVRRLPVLSRSGRLLGLFLLPEFDADDPRLGLALRRLIEQQTVEA